MSSPGCWSYPSAKCIMEFVDPNKRIFLAKQCPSLRQIHVSVPLHTEVLNLVLSESIIINNFQYNTLDLVSKNKREELFNGMFPNPKTPIYVEEFSYASSGDFEKIKSTVVPKSLVYVNCDPKTGSLSERSLSLLENDSFVDIKNVKKLKVVVTDGFDDLAKHPIIGQLDHLEVLVDDHRFVSQTDTEKLSDIPVPHLSIGAVSVRTAIMILLDWMFRKERHRKFSVVISKHPIFLIPCLSRFVQLKKGIYEARQCWVHYYEETSSAAGYEVVLFFEDYECDPTKKKISLQILPKGSALPT